VIQQTLSPFRAASAQGFVQVANAALHAIAGAGLGMLFWLSWGLVAVVNVSWWERGLIFGLCTWSMLVPALLIARVEGRYSSAALLGMLTQMFSTCTLAGIACGWAWAKAP
jgi:hypothetical protein